VGVRHLARPAIIIDCACQVGQERSSHSAHTYSQHLRTPVNSHFIEYPILQAPQGQGWPMLLRSAMLAAVNPRTQACLVPAVAQQAQISLQLDVLRCLSIPASPHISKQPCLAPHAQPAQPAATAAAATVAAQRALSLRCYSNAQASSSAPETSSGQRKLKYNLRPLGKGEQLSCAAFKSWQCCRCCSCPRALEAAFVIRFYAEKLDFLFPAQPAQVTVESACDSHTHSASPWL
jgi:hypothetical protein